MRIVHLLWSLGTGGVETMIVDIVNEQSKTDSVSIIMINDLYDVNVLNRIVPAVKVINCGRTPGSKSLLPIIRLNLELLKLRPDILHFHLDDQTKLVLPIYKSVRTFHNTHSKCDDMGRYKRVYCISNSVKRFLSGKGFNDGVVIYNGIHPDYINIHPSGLFKNDTIKHFVSVGRLHPDKGQRVLIEAINYLVNERDCCNFAVDLIGDGPNRDELESLVSKYGLQEHIIFRGAMSRQEIYTILCEYQLYIMPSISEGFGLTLAEACLAKIPVITSDLEGPMEVISNGLYGKSFVSSDYIDLAEKIEGFIEEGYENTMIQGAYQYVLDNFDIRVTALRYLQDYMMLTNE